MGVRRLERLGYNATLVLQAMSRGHRYGFEIMKVADLPSGTVYPLLRRLERTRLAESRWEDVDPSDEGRPRRRNYRITPEGERALAAAVERMAARQALFGLPAGRGGGRG